MGPAGSWYDLGTVTLAAGDLSSTVTIAYSDSDTGVSQVALLEQTSATVYDPAGNVLSQTDGLGRVTTTGYNNLEQPVSTAQGQVVPLTSGTAAFNNLPQTPGVPRTFTVYVQASSAPSDGSDYSISESGSASPTLVTSISATTPLGEGWYELGTITLGESDTSSTLTVHYSGSGVTNVCLVQPISAETYTPTGLVASQTNGNGDFSVATYDALGEATAASQGQTAALRHAARRRWETWSRRRGSAEPTRSTCNRRGFPPAALRSRRTATTRLRSPRISRRRLPSVAAGTNWAQ